MYIRKDFTLNLNKTIRKRGTTTETNNPQANKGSPLLSEEVPYQITLIRCSRGGLDRRGEKVVWEMFTENDCNLQHPTRLRT